MRMKLFFAVLVFLKFSFNYAQNEFDFNQCSLNLKVKYSFDPNGSIKLNFSKIFTDQITLPSNLPNNSIIKSEQNKKFAADFLDSKFLQSHDFTQIEIISFDNSTKKLDYTINLENEGYIPYDNIEIGYKKTYKDLILYLKHYDKSIVCDENKFIDELKKNIQVIKDNLIYKNTTKDGYRNSQIIRLKENETTYEVKKKFPNTDEEIFYNEDIRNPISFTNFLIRNPRTNGNSRIVVPSNLSSFQYIRPGSIIGILFDKEIYQKLNNVKISISSYLKRKDGSVVPININGFQEVNLQTNQIDFEKNGSKLNSFKSSNDSPLNYNYTVLSKTNFPIQVELNLENLNPSTEDIIFITVKNVDDNNASFTMIFEYEDFGWTSQASGGFAWVNDINSKSNDFVAAGSSSYNFYYEWNKGDRFLYKLFIPGFGPELLVHQDSQQKTLVGLGASVSTLMRTVKFGYGWYLNGNNGQPYFSIGVNFVEGFHAISSILNNVRTTTP